MSGLLSMEDLEAGYQRRQGGPPSSSGSGDPSISARGISLEELESGYQRNRAAPYSPSGPGSPSTPPHAPSLEDLEADSQAGEGQRALEEALRNEAARPFDELPSAGGRQFIPGISSPETHQALEPLSRETPAAGPEPGMLGRIKERYEAGQSHVGVGLLRARQLMGETSPELDAQIESLKATSPQVDRKARRNIVEKALGAAAEMAPTMLSGMEKGVKRGAVLGGGAAAIAAASGVGAPPAAIGMFGVGMTSGIMENIGMIEAGLAYDELLDLHDAQGNPIDPSVAKAAAAGVGVVNGLLELAQIKTLARTFPGGDKFLRGAIRQATKKAVESKALNNLAFRAAKRYGTTIAAETLQEVAQESTNIIADELSKNLTNRLKDAEFEPAEASKIAQRIANTAKESALAFSVMALPGTVATGIHEGRAPRQEVTLAEEEPLPPEQPPPVPGEALPPETAPAPRPTPKSKARGNEATVIHQEGKDTGRYVLMELDDLQPSHLADRGFSKNPNYPEGVQRRQYHADKAEQLKVQGNAQKFDPTYLVTDNPDAVNGPPIATEDMTILGGNGRTQTLQLIYRDHPEKADLYKAELRYKAAQFGLDPAEVDLLKKPALVRVLDETPADTKALAKKVQLYDTPPTQAVDIKAEAISRARLVSPETMERIAGALEEHESLRAYMGKTGSKALIKDLVRDGVLDKTQLNRLINQATGLLSDDGKQLVERTLLGTVIQDYDAMDAAPPAALNKIEKALPALAQLKARGEGWDITGMLNEALGVYTRFKATNFKRLDEYFAQGDMFTTEAVDTQTRTLVEALDALGLVSFKKAMDQYAAYARQDVKGQGTLGFITPETPASAFEKVFKAKEPRQAAAQGSAGLAMSKEELERGYQKKRWLKRRKKALVSRRQIVAELRKAFKIPILGKATTRWRKVLGKYFIQPEVIRSKETEDIFTIAHEIAHHIQKRTWGWGMWGRDPATGKKKMRRFPLTDKALRAEIMPLAYPGADNKTVEGFAEYVRFWVTDREDAKQKAPKFTAYWEKFLDENPDIGEPMRRFQDLTRQYLEQGAVNRVKSQIDWTGRGIKEPIRDKMLRGWLLFRQYFEDDLYPPERQLKALGIKEKLTPAKDPIEVARMVKRKASAKAEWWVNEGVTDWMGKKVGKSLREITEPVSKDLEDAITFAYALSAQARYFPRGLNPGITRQDAAYTIEQLDSPRFRKFAEELTAWSDGTLQYLIDAGGLGPAEADLMRSLNPIYIPFKRVFIDQVESYRSGGGRGYETKGGPPVHRAKGSGRAIRHPFDSMIENVTQIIMWADKVRVARLFVDVGEKYEAMGAFGIKVPAPMKSTTFKLEDISKQIEDLFGDKPLDQERILTIFTQGTQYTGKDQIITIWRNGKREFYEVENQYIFQALKGIEPANIHPVIRFLFGKATRALRLTATGISPRFGLIRNPFKDSLTFTINTQAKFPNPFLPIKGVVMDLRNTPGGKAWRYRALGGEFATIMGQDRESRMKVIDQALLKHKGMKGKSIYVAKHPVDALRKLIQIPEMGPRIAEFEKVLERAEKKHGKGSPDAVVEAFNAGQDVTVNFSRAGIWGPLFNEMIAFWNPCVQGDMKLMRMAKHRPVALILRGVAALSLPSLYLWWENRDKEWYQQLDPEYKYMNWFFEIGDTVARLPKPFEYGLLFAAGVEAFLDFIYEEDPEALKAWFNDFVASTWPGMPGQAPAMLLAGEKSKTEIGMLAPVWEVATNRDWLGRSIETEGQKRFEPPDRIRPGTTKIAKTLAKALHRLYPEKDTLSPVQIDHIINGYLGGLGYGLSRVTGKKEDPADLPVVGTLFLRKSYKPSKDLEKFYRASDLLQQGAASAKIHDRHFPREADLKEMNRARRRLADLWKDRAAAIEAGNKDELEFIGQEMTFELENTRAYWDKREQRE